MFFSYQVILSCGPDKGVVLRKVKLSHRGVSSCVGPPTVRPLKMEGALKIGPLWHGLPLLADQQGINSATVRCAVLSPAGATSLLNMCVRQARAQTTALLCAQRCWLVSYVSPCVLVPECFKCYSSPLS